MNEASRKVTTYLDGSDGRDCTIALLGWQCSNVPCTWVGYGRYDFGETSRVKGEGGEDRMEVVGVI